MDKIEREIIVELNEHLRELLALLHKLVNAGPGLLAEGPPPDSPEGEKDYIARRLGRTRAGLDSLIQKYKQAFKADPPFVIRKPGLSWLPDVAVFEEWRKTTEGKKSVVKRKRGRSSRR